MKTLVAPPSHPAADIFPMLSESELADLASDIRDHGLLSTIVMLDGKILDGRNRMLACLRVGVEPRTEEFTGSNPVAYVVSKNLRRRHMDESQRAMVAGRVASLEPGRPSEETRSIDRVFPVAEAAKMLNVGESSVTRARRVITKGSPDLQSAVERGDVPVSRAAQVVHLPKPKQLEAAISKSKTVEVQPPASKPRRIGKTFGGIAEAPQSHYGSVWIDAVAVSQSELSDLDISMLASKPGAHVWLWVKWDWVRSGFVNDLLKDWGATWVSHVVWHKCRVGVGQWLKVTTELGILATIGPVRNAEDSSADFFDAPPDRYGSKPLYAFSVAERISPGPRVSLFSTIVPDGWDAVGDHVEIIPRGDK